MSASVHLPLEKYLYRFSYGVCFYNHDTTIAYTGFQLRWLFNVWSNLGAL